MNCCYCGVQRLKAKIGVSKIARKSTNKKLFHPLVCMYVYET